jgi:hypothetical protein
MKKLLLILVGLVGLIVFQYKVIVPLVFDVAATDIFLKDTETEANPQSTNTPMTNYAFMHCNNYIRDEIDSELTITFPSEPINAWDIAGYQYVVNAEIEISSNTSAPYSKKYVCRIKYDKGIDQDGMMNSENWSVYGLSGLDDI